MTDRNAHTSNPANARPLSFAQERLWLAQAIEPESYRYNEVTVHRLTGELSASVLAASIVRLAARHEVLRTVYALDDAGVLQQWTRPTAELKLAVVDLSNLDTTAATAAVLRLELARLRSKPFHLAEELPARAVLFRTANAGESFLALSVHHIACDRVSAAIFIRELRAIYEATSRGEEANLQPLRAQYADFAAWERRHYTDERLAHEADYWAELLEGASAPELPFRKRTQALALEAAAHTLTLDAPFVRTLTAFARKSGTTAPNVLLAALACLVARYTGERKIAVALPLAARHRPEIENLIGLFINTVVVGLEAPPEAAFAQVLKRISRRAFEVYARGGVPFNRVAERQGIAVEPLLEMAWTYLGNGLAESETAGALRFEPVGELLADKAVFPLEFLLVETGGRIEMRLVYARELFDEAATARFLSNYERLLRAAVASPAGRLSELEIIGDEERAQLFAQGTGAKEEQATKDFLELFRAHVERTPTATAVSLAQVAQGSFTYAELEAQAERIARLIRERKLEKEATIAVISERVPEVLACLLACLKTNTSYLPISRTYPRERVREILSDARVKLALTFRAYADDADGTDAEVILLDETQAPRDEAERQPVSDIETHACGRAYIIYTSGSTGRPKGVMVERGGMLNHLLAKVSALELTPSDVVAFNAPVSFDISIWQMLAPLSAGAAVRFVSEAGSADPARLIEEIVVGGVTVFETVPSMLGAMLDTPECSRLNESKLRWLISNAEALPPGMCRRFQEKFPSIRLLNAYGPTECSDDVTHFEIIAPADYEIVPIGSPVRNTQLYVLDAAGRICPAGAAGELYIGGAGVSRGYAGRPDLTAERFVPDAFGTLPGARLYRTGDVVRWRADGRLEFLGRQDQQVKLRGYRIELGEIEAALSTHTGVRQCAVVVAHVAGAQTLVAYFAGEADTAALKEHAAQQLPSYMIPQRFIRLDALPLTTNGKVDRKALPAPDTTEDAAAHYLAPRTPTEEIICNVWAEVLGRERVGVDEDFFTLGGHSLLATQVVSRVRAVFGVEVALRVLFETPTAEALAAEVERLRNAGSSAGVVRSAPPLVRADRSKPLPLSFAQQRLWFIDQLEPGNPAYNVPFAVRLTGALDVAALSASLDEIVRRHETLRTTFSTVDGQPVQLIHEARPVPLPFTDMSHLPATEREEAACELSEAEAGRAFDLAADSLLRARLVRLSEAEHVLVVVMHHIISDGWSTGVLMREFSQLYAAYQAGQPSPLAELPIQYADYAVWQRESLQGEVLESQLAYWREQLAGMDRLELPSDLARVDAWERGGSVVRFELSAELTESLRELSRREGVTLFMVLMAAWQLLLSRY
ncbi:MAG TPA: amino acid adenylation domain-containing protein, partial [Pyrinomonadaceae bacterium]|nr:amino acid adenylation domain-containing protein [Pyrinomonadaceae bacterium]